MILHFPGPQNNGLPVMRQNSIVRSVGIKSCKITHVEVMAVPSAARVWLKVMCQFVSHGYIKTRTHPSAKQNATGGALGLSLYLSMSLASQSYVPNASSAAVRIRYKCNIDCAYGNGFIVLAKDLDVDILRYRFPGEK
jgi:hypothetical protein